MCVLSGVAILTTIAAGVCVMIYGDGGGVDQHFNKFMEEFMKDGILEIGGNDTIPVWTMIPAGVALLGMFPICVGSGSNSRKACSIALLILSILVAVFMPSILAGIEILAAENAPDTEAQVVVPDAEVAEVQADEVPDDAEVQADESLKTNTIVVASVGGGVSGLAGVGAYVATSGKKNKEIPTEDEIKAILDEVLPLQQTRTDAPENSENFEKEFEAIVNKVLPLEQTRSDAPENSEPGTAVDGNTEEQSQTPHRSRKRNSHWMSGKSHRTQSATVQSVTSQEPGQTSSFPKEERRLSGNEPGTAGPPTYCTVDETLPGRIEQIEGEQGGATNPSTPGETEGYEFGCSSDSSSEASDQAVQKGNTPTGFGRLRRLLSQKVPRLTKNSSTHRRLVTLERILDNQNAADMDWGVIPEL
jgi:uncharacterized membrane protein